MRRLIGMLGVTSMMTLGACLVECPGIILAVELEQDKDAAQQKDDPYVSEGYTLIFADGFESGDTSHKSVSVPK